MAEPMTPDDPAWWMVQRGMNDPSWRSTPQVFMPGCFICEDTDFELMGLPLCKPCGNCQAAGRGDGHIPADDVVCSICGGGDPAYEDWLNSLEEK